MPRLGALLFTLVCCAHLLADGTGASSWPGPFHSSGEGAYFPVRSEIWKTDGTSEGTVVVARVEEPWTDGPIALGERVIFSAGSYPAIRLYASDSTGTREVYQFARAAFVVGTARLADRVYLLVQNHETLQLWTTDGTAAGTRLVTEMPAADEATLVTAGDHVFFSIYEFSTDEYSVWRSDGSAEGTERFARHEYDPRLTVYGGGVVFEGILGNSADPWADPPPRAQICRSDGTRGGTHALTDRGDFFVAGGTLWLLDLPRAAGTRTLYRSKGTPETTNAVWYFDASDTLVGANEDGKVFVATRLGSGWQLWVLDPERRTQIALAIFESFGSWSATPVAIGSTFYFAATTAGHGTELWRSDATPAGTSLLRDIAPAAESAGVAYLTRVGSRLVFSASDRRRGHEPWVSDGSPAGTRILANISAESSIEGRVIDGATGTATANATVALTQPRFGNADVYVTEVVTDGDGKFAIRNLEYELSRLRVTSETHLTQATDTFELAEGETKQVEIALQRGATIAGRAVDANGAAVAGVPIEVVETIDGAPVATTTTAPDGTYAVAVRSGSWLVSTGGLTYSRVIYDGVRCVAGCDASSGGTRVVVFIGDRRNDVNFTVLPHGRIRGRVIDPTSGRRPETTVTLRLVNTTTPDSSRTIYPDQNGLFDVVAGDGTYRLFVDLSGWQAGGYTPNVPAEGLLVTPSHDSNGVGHQIIVSPTQGRVRGRVVDAGTREPLARIHVKITAAEFTAWATTADDGTYSSPLLSPGRHLVEVFGSETHAAAGPIAAVNVESGAAADVGETALRRFAAVRVRVFDAVTALQMGVQTFENLAPGTHVLSTAPVGWRKSESIVTVGYDDPPVIDVVLEPACRVTAETPPLVSANRSEIAVRVDAPCAFCVATASSFVTPSCHGAGQPTLRVHLARNDSGTPRTALLVLPGGAVTITQDRARGKSRAAGER